MVIEGEIRVTIGSEDYYLTQGDAFRFASNLPHGIANASDKRSMVVRMNARS